MYATAAVIAYQVKEKRTPNSRKDYTHTPGLPEGQ